MIYSTKRQQHILESDGETRELEKRLNRHLRAYQNLNLQSDELLYNISQTTFALPSGLNASKSAKKKLMRSEKGHKIKESLAQLYCCFIIKKILCTTGKRHNKYT